MVKEILDVKVYAFETLVMYLDSRTIHRNAIRCSSGPLNFRKLDATVVGISYTTSGFQKVAEIKRFENCARFPLVCQKLYRPIWNGLFGRIIETRFSRVE